MSFFCAIHELGGSADECPVCLEPRLLRARVAELEAERLRFYHADGTFEVFATPEAVIQRRIECAQRLGL